MVGIREWTQHEIDAARAMYTYCPLTGEFRYARNSFRARSSTVLRVRKGDIAGTIPKPGVRGKNYAVLCVGGIRVLAHRLAYMLHNGPITPGKYVDHISTDTTDNRLTNLRLVSAKGNQENRKAPQKNGSSGHIGVSYDKSRNKYQAKIKSGGVHVNIGRYETAEEAYAAYVQAKRRLHTEGNTL